MGSGLALAPSFCSSAISPASAVMRGPHPPIKAVLAPLRPDIRVRSRDRAERPGPRTRTRRREAVAARSDRVPNGGDGPRLRESEAVQPGAAREPQVGPATADRVDVGDLPGDLHGMRGVGVHAAGAQAHPAGPGGADQQGRDRRLHAQVAEHAQHVEPQRLHALREICHLRGAEDRGDADAELSRVHLLAADKAGPEALDPHHHALLGSGHEPANPPPASRPGRAAAAWRAGGGAPPPGRRGSGARALREHQPARLDEVRCDHRRGARRRHARGSRPRQAQVVSWFRYGPWWPVAGLWRPGRGAR